MSKWASGCQLRFAYWLLELLCMYVLPPDKTWLVGSSVYEALKV